MKMNKKAVSAVIGVILMVAIAVAIAATVYIYVENNLRQEQEQEPLYVEGWVVDAYDILETYTIDGQNYSIWYVSLGQSYDTSMENATSYNMIFTHSMSPPSEGVHLRLFYTVEDTYLDVNNVVSL